MEKTYTPDAIDILYDKIIEKGTTAHLKDIINIIKQLLNEKKELLNILNDINRLSSKDIIILFKPQFEVGTKVKRDKKGVVKDKNAIKKARETFLEKTETLKWKQIYTSFSKLQGKDGNEEELFYFSK